MVRFKGEITSATWLDACSLASAAGRWMRSAETGNHLLARAILQYGRARLAFAKNAAVHQGADSVDVVSRMTAGRFHVIRFNRPLVATRGSERRLPFEPYAEVLARVVAGPFRTIPADATSTNQVS